ncbi:MAG: YitT family protein [Vicinamibacterales bacterium]
MTVSPLLREIRNGLLILAGIMSAGLGLKGFLLAGGLIDGGVTGVSMLLDRVTALPLALWLPIVNLPFVAVGWRVIGPTFAVRSAIGISGLAIALALVDFPEVTTDRLLEAVFGGFFLGGGIGLAMRGGAVLDGTEIAALLISKRSHVLKVGDVILVFNSVLFLAAMSVLGVESALYSILTYFTAAKTLDFVIHGIEEYTAITIVSSKADAIRAALTTSLGRGVTVYRGYGGKSGSEQHILFCVVTRLEIGGVKAIIKGIDDAAFIVSHSLSEVEGGVVRRAALR